MKTNTRGIRNETCAASRETRDAQGARANYLFFTFFLRHFCILFLIIWCVRVSCVHLPWTRRILNNRECALCCGCKKDTCKIKCVCRRESEPRHKKKQQGNISHADTPPTFISGRTRALTLTAENNQNISEKERHLQIRTIFYILYSQCSFHTNQTQPD
jgi:hypothetical protein